MSSNLLRKSTVVTSQIRNDIPFFTVGSVVDVYYKIKEGNKERIQVFSGLVTNKKSGDTIDGTFTVLKNATGGIKVERTFPINSPIIDKVVVVVLQRARKANLQFLGDVKDPIKSVRAKSVKIK